MESPAAANATERERELECALAKMWFAYANKDADNPHDFEKEKLYGYI